MWWYKFLMSCSWCSKISNYLIPTSFNETVSKMGIAQTVCNLASIERKCEMFSIPTEMSLNPHFMLLSVTGITVSCICVHTHKPITLKSTFLPIELTFSAIAILFLTWLRKKIFFQLIVLQVSLLQAARNTQMSYLWNKLNLTKIQFSTRELGLNISVNNYPVHSKWPYSWSVQVAFLRTELHCQRWQVF